MTTALALVPTRHNEEIDVTWREVPQRHGNAGNYEMVSRDTTEDGIVEMWLSTGKRKNSPNTQAQYRRQWAKFRETVGKPLQDVTLEDLTKWQNSLTGAETTRRTQIATLRSLYSFCVRVGYLLANFGVMLEPPPAPQAVHRRTLSRADVVRTQDACATARETALIAVLYSSGARVSEVLALQWQDVTPRDNGGAVLHIVYGKGRKERKAGIDAAAYAAILALRTEDTTPADFVFHSRTGKPLDRQQAHRIVARVAKRAGLKDAAQTPSPHWFRHSHATQSIAAGANPVDVQAQLGHSSLAVTSIYAQPQGFSSDKL